MKRTFTIVAALIATLSLVMPAAGIAGKTAKVKVEDDFFTPTTVSVKKNKDVAFKWASDNLNTHNVTLTKGPKSLKFNPDKPGSPCAKGKITNKCNRSASGSIGVNFKPTFAKPGTYKFVCTIHPTVMKVTVKVDK